MKSEKKKIPIINNGTKRVSKEIPEGLDGFTIPIGWNFSMMDTDKNCPWRCTFKALSKYRKRLMSFEGKSFKDIENANDSSHSWPETDKLNKKFRDLLKNKNIDADSLWQLELGGKERLFGVRVLNVFKVIWLDKNHSIYKVEKRHT